MSKYPAINLGDRFGHLVVIESRTGYADKKRRWFCKCDCGGYTLTVAYKLHRGETKTCGCRRDRVKFTEGSQVGELTVVKYLGVRRSSKAVRGKGFWQCRCSCGNLVETSSSSLTEGTKTNCGCKTSTLLSERLYARWADNDKLETCVKQIKKQAGARGLTWDLPLEFARALLEQDCSYCGDPPEEDSQGRVRNTIDRIDNSRGYVVGNVCTACHLCNMLKKQYSLDAFIEKAEKITNRFKTKLARLNEDIQHGR